MFIRQYAGLGEVARALQIDPAAVSRRVARLEAKGRITTRSGPNRMKLINLADFSRVTGIDVERLKLPSIIELIAARGGLGAGANLERRVAACRRYCELIASPDAEAKKIVEKIDGDLGCIDRDLVHAVLVRNRSMTEIAQCNAWRVASVLDRFCVALDVIACQLGFH